VVARQDTDGAIDAMRERYVAVGVQIADTLTVLAKAAANAPSKARTATLTAISRIAAAQEKLSDETRRLPASPVERFALMQSVLQAQQGALVQLALIVKQLGAPATGRFGGGGKSNQLARYQLAPTQLATPELGSAVFVSRRTNADESEEIPDRRAMGRIQKRRQARSRARARAREERRTARAHRSPSRRISVFFKAAVSRSLLVVIVVASGLLIAYGTFPRAGDGPTTRRIELPTRTPTAATPLPVPRAEPSVPPQRTARVPSSETNTRVAIREPMSAPAPSEPPAPPPQAAPQYVVRSAPSGVSFAAPIPTANGPRIVTAPETRNNPPISPTAPAKPEPAPERTVVATITTPANTPDAGFVPVLFTHKDQAIVNRAITELQHRFPAQLRHRKVESQAVDMGEKGVWHRLVMLPPGPREQADTICQALMAGGYDRCWVKAY
jgi:hypothetical protein